MFYRFSHPYETLEDIEKEYNDPYRHGAMKYPPGTYSIIRLKRERAAKARQSYLDSLQTADKNEVIEATIAANVAAESGDIASAQEALERLQLAIARLKSNKTIEIPFDPGGYYEL